MPDQPLAYLITFSTYGTWLHGDDRGSVDQEHNCVDSPLLEPDPVRRRIDQARMTQGPYRMDERRRSVACEGIVEECRFRGWLILAAHVRSNHVHLVVSAADDPDSVMKKCKGRASRRLNLGHFDAPGRKRWTEHGSTKYLWSIEAVIHAVDYVLNRQGVAMARYEGPWRKFVEQV